MPEDNKFTIKIESILGGHAPTTHFASADQFRNSIGIDPSLPINDASDDPFSFIASGLLRPTAYSEFGDTVGAPQWIIEPPNKRNVTGIFYVYDSDGSVYSFNATATPTLTGLGDLNDGGSASGNGAAYYDNYVYFARDTTIARYGPLDSVSPAFTDDYWVTTLGKTALTDTGYSLAGNGILPNHVLHRHSDGKLYIADVVGNQGTIHYIATTKTTVEGDTDNGSTYSKIQVGYGLYPTAIESYGSNLVISFIETTNTGGVAPRAKLAFWDTTSQNINQIIWVEFPDPLISGLKNINGILYVISGKVRNSSPANSGFRVSKFIGGYTFEEVFYSELGDPSISGAMDGTSKRLLIGSAGRSPDAGVSTAGVGCVYSIGLQKALLSQGLFNIAGATTANSYISALHIPSATNLLRFDLPYIGLRKVSTATGAIAYPSENYSNAVSTMWWSQLYRIGQPFKITKIRFPLAQAVSVGMIVTPKIYTDDGAGTAYTLTTINDTNDLGKFNIVRRSGSSGEVITGQHNFWVECKWSGGSLCTVGLPITIDYELLDD